MKSKSAVAYFYLFTAFFCWGSMYVVNRYVMTTLPVTIVTCLRVAVALLALLVMARKTLREKIDRRDRLSFLLLGALGYYFTVLMNSLSTYLAGASMASLINSLTPVCVTIIAALVLKERITPVRILCLALALAGTYIVSTNAETSGQILGIVAALAGVVSWGYASTLMRRLAQKYKPLLVTTYGMAVGLALHIPTAAVRLATMDVATLQFSWQAALAILYMGVVSTALGQSLWTRSLALLEAGVCSLFYPMQPFFSVVLGMMFLGERPGVRFFLGSALIAADVIINCLHNRKLERQHGL